jgi:hypothetical protein
MAPQRVYGMLNVYPAFQEAGELRVDSTILSEIAERRGHGNVPLAFLFADCETAAESFAIPLGRYSQRHQVWEFDPDLAGDSELVPPNRRTLSEPRGSVRRT